MKKLTSIIIISIILMQCMQHTHAQSWKLTGNAGTDAGTQFIGTTDNKAFKIRTNNNVRITINPSGKVGIGTTSPAFKLDVKGSINTDSLYRIGGYKVLSADAGNTFVGINSGLSSTFGTYATGIGFQALYKNTTGSNNTATGSYALFSNTTGSYNTAHGYAALYLNTTGNSNTACGYEALYSNTSGDYNSANGTAALSQNSTGHDNTATGYAALISNTTGSYNTANGNQALYFNTTGLYNTANGWAALYKNTTGIYNTATGLNALYSNATGSNNNAHGYAALFLNTTGNFNTADGWQALYTNNTGNYNTALGSYGLMYTTASDGNTAVGYGAGYNFNNGYYNTFLGTDADANAGAYYNSIAVGNAATVTAPLQVRIGSSIMTSIGGYQNWSNISDGRYKKNVKEDVKGIDFIMKLRPVTYNLDVSGISEKLNESRGKEMSEQTKKSIADKEQIIYSGFIAQEVEKSAKEIGYDFSGVDAPKNENDFYGLRYAEFVVPLVKAAQELNAVNEELKTKNEELEKRISALENQSSMTDGFLQAKISTLGGDLEGALLGQNIPNPFDNSTLIPFSIPKDCRDASIMITNITTSQVLRVIPISCNQDHVSIDAGTLASGTYSYSLYVDGMLIQTNEMVIVR